MSYCLSANASNKELLEYLKLPSDSAVISKLSALAFAEPGRYFVYVSRFCDELNSATVHYSYKRTVDSGIIHKAHNEFGPAYLEFDYGKLIVVAYYQNNVYHRVGKPAFITFNKGIINKEKYYVKGKLHNRVGPAKRFLYSRRWINVFYINGQVLELDEFCKRVS